MTNWLTKIVSTTLVVLTGCTIALALTVFYMVATVFGKDLDPVTFGSMLAFAASAMGIGYKQFKAKRETSWAEDEDGVAYKPLTSSAMADVRKNRYDVGAFPQRTPIREIGDGFGQPGSKDHQPTLFDEPESVEEHENAGRRPAPMTEPEPEIEDGWEEEGA